jgi:hypothetical protein
MYTYDDLAELARICAKNSHIASSKEVSAKLWELAQNIATRQISAVLAKDDAFVGVWEHRVLLPTNGFNGS